MMELSQGQLKELLNYNPETGIFTWNINVRYDVKPGAVAGCKNKEGYTVIKIHNKSYKAHRLAFLYMEGYLPENQVDHIDRDRKNNKWCNLRHVSRSCNIKNSKIRADNLSGVTGVSWHKRIQKWISRISVNEKRICLGYYKSFKDAVLSRWEAEKKHNYPGCNTKSTAHLYLKKRGLI